MRPRLFVGSVFVSFPERRLRWVVVYLWRCNHREGRPLRGGNAPRQVPTKEEGRNGRGGQGIGFVSTYIDVNWKLAIGERGGVSVPFKPPGATPCQKPLRVTPGAAVDLLHQAPQEDT